MSDLSRVTEITTDVFMPSATYERTEFDRCTPHDQPIVAMTSVRVLSSNALIRFDPPVIMHRNEYGGVTGICGDVGVGWIEVDDE